MQFIDFAAAQVFHHGGQINFSVGVGQVGDGCSARFQSCFFSIILHRGVDIEGATSYENMSVQRGLQTAVNHYKVRLTRRFDQTNIEPRIVLKHRAYTRQDRTRARPPGVTIGARGFRGDPLALAILKRCPAIERSRNFHAHPGCLADHAAEKADVEFTGFGCAGADFDFDAGSAQALKTLT